MSEIQLTVPMPPNVTNRRSGGSHWRTIYREKQQFSKTLDALQAAGILPPPPPLPFRKAMVISVMYLGAAMDDDNAMARHKPVMDWLKTRGYIVDDRKKCLSWYGLPEQVIKRDGNYRIVLTLRAL